MANDIFAHIVTGPTVEGTLFQVRKGPRSKVGRNGVLPVSQDFFVRFQNLQLSSDALPLPSGKNFNGTPR